MKALVTGGGGFIGSHVVEALARDGYEVLAIDRLARWKALGPHPLGEGIERHSWDLIGALPGVTRQEWDVRYEDEVDAAVKDAEVIVHTAAQVAAAPSMADPRRDMETNAFGTFNVLEAARKAGTDPTVIVCSTRHVYGDRVCEIPVREEETRYAFADPAYAAGIPEEFGTEPAYRTPHGTSMLVADLYAQEYAKTYGLRTAVVRLSTVYGPRQFGTEDQGWVSHVAMATMRRERLRVFGDGKQVRDVLYVDDLVDAFRAYVERARQLGPRLFNLGGGPENTLSVLELVRILERRLGYIADVGFSEPRDGDPKVYVSNISKAREALAWSPKVPPEEGVHRFVDWFRAQPFGKRKRIHDE